MAHFFPQDYVEARQQFCCLAALSGATITSYVLPGHHGPQGEELALDVARLGPAQASRLLLISSGVHGIEGYTGSAAQCAALQKGIFDLTPPDTAVVLAHAVNPWGFAYNRRCDQDGIDLNRNFIDWSAKSPEEHPQCEFLMRNLFASPPRERPVKAFIQRQGISEYHQALVKGQYRFPQGLCYGGVGPAWSNQVWSEMVQSQAQGVEEIVHIDLHTGAGPVADTMILPADNATPAQIERARGWWGDQVVLPSGTPAATSASLAGLAGPIEGSFSLICPAQVSVQSVTVECGNLPFDEVVRCLVADHQRAAQGAPQTPKSIAQLRQAYAPLYEGWQRKATRAMSYVLFQAVHGLRRDVWRGLGPSRLG